jgi:hypothetical protein
MFVGLTKPAIDKVNELLEVCRELGCTTMEQAAEVLTEKEFMLVRMAKKVHNNPELDLWMQHPCML